MMWLMLSWFSYGGTWIFLFTCCVFEWAFPVTEGAIDPLVIHCSSSHPRQITECFSCVFVLLHSQKSLIHALIQKQYIQICLSARRTYCHIANSLLFGALCFLGESLLGVSPSVVPSHFQGVLFLVFIVYLDNA